jgi:DNA-binding SARP family transcriptional activator/predicted ATPase
MLYASGKVQSTMTPAQKLHIHLFGAPQILRNDRPFPILRSQHRALLYRLAATLEPVGREQLCFLFWPDTNDANARRQLTQSLSHLRRALPAPDLLVTTKDHAYLDPARVWVDSAAFAALINPTDPAARKHGSEEATERLKAAVDLYTGPFLYGFSLPGCPEFEQWLRRERRHNEQCVLDALLALLNDATARSAYAESIGYARRYLVVDELAEEVHRRLIDLYARSGDRSAARQQFEACAAILEQELGVEPLPETQAAYQAALAVRPPPRPPPPALAWATLSSLEMPLVGRDHALARLEQGMMGADQGRGCITLIAGEAGIGKSRLLQAFATAWQDRALVLAGAAQPGEQMLPYQPLAQALRRGISLAGPHLPVEPVWLAEAAVVLPELHTFYPNLPLPVQTHANQARTQLFEALTQLTLALAAGAQPLLLCLDDLHWTDSATLDWLAYLGARLHSHRLLVVGTYRQEEPDAVAGLRRALRRAGVLVEVELAGLDDDAVHQLLRNADHSLVNGHALARHLQRATAGNTFFLLETLRAFLETNRKLDELFRMESLPAPKNVSEIITARLSRLSTMARQLLEAGAVLGLIFSFPLVQQTAGRTELEAIDGLDELVGRHLLREAADGYQFHHELIRQVVYQNLSRWRRQLLHRRSAETLAVLYRADLDAVSGQMAAHFEQARLPASALPFYRQAAQVALQRFAHQEAVALLGKGIDLLQALPETPERHRQEIELQIMLGSALIATRGFAAVEMKQAYERAWTLAQGTPHTHELFHALWGLWSFYNTQGQIHTALEVGRQLWELADAGHDADQMLGACRALGSTLFHAGQLQLAQTYQVRGIAFYEPQQHHRSHILHYGADSAVVCLSSLTLTLWMLGYPDQALTCCDQVLALAEELAHPFSQAFALDYMAWFHHFRRDAMHTHACTEAVIALCEQHGFKQLRAMGTVLNGWAVADQGQLGAGIEQIEQGLRDWRSTGSVVGSVCWHYMLAEAYGKRGQPEKGLHVLAEALAEIEQRGERRGEPELHRLRGELLWQQGTPGAEVEACFQQALATARSQQAKTFELRAAVSLAHLWQQQDLGVQARELLAPIIGWFTEGFDTLDLQEARALLEGLA